MSKSISKEKVNHEDVNINVNDKVVEDVRGIIKVDENGNGSLETKKLNGLLKMIYIDANVFLSKITFTVSDGDFVLLRDNDLGESRLYSLKIRDRNENGLLMGTYSHYTLNNKLSLHVRNAIPNSNIRVVIRYAAN